MPLFPIFLSMILILISCGSDQNSDLQSLSRELDDRMSFWRDTGALCQGFPSKEHCDDGDANLFNGLLCAAGEEASCDAVKEAQSTNGQWWRSPRRNPGNLEKVIPPETWPWEPCYLATTGDQAAQWRTGIAGWRIIVLVDQKPVYGGCIHFDSGDTADEGGNPNCNVSNSQWALMEKVWRNIELEPKNVMKRNRNFDDRVSVLKPKITNPAIACT